MTNINLKELSVKELKDLIKENAASTGQNLPTGMWKMTRDELITVAEELFTDLIEENEAEVETEEKIEVETETEEVKPEKTEEKIDEEKTPRGRRTKQVKMTNLENNETTVFDKADDAHKWLKANHNLGYSHIKQSCEGKQTKKLAAANITFEWVTED